MASLINVFALQMETAGIMAGVIFFLVLAAVAYVSFRVLRRTVKMALRMTIILVILLIAIVGSFGIYWFSQSDRPPSRPATRTR